MGQLVSLISVAIEGFLGFLLLKAIVSLISTLEVLFNLGAIGVGRWLSDEEYLMF